MRLEVVVAQLATRSVKPNVLPSTLPYPLAVDSHPMGRVLFGASL